MTCRRACRSPRLAKVISRSASGRSRLAFASVVVIRSCSNSDVARLASISRSCAGPAPSRGPLVGVGMWAPSRYSLEVSRRAGSSWNRGAPAERFRGVLQLLGLGVVGLVAEVVGEVVRAVTVDGGRQREPGRAVLEREPQAGQLHLDLVDGL